MSGAFRRLNDRLVHAGHIWSVVVGSFEGPDGEHFERDIVRSPGAVGVIPVGDEDDPTLILVRQYRPAYEESIFEIPAGMRDVPGEEPLETARRELAEEVGLEAGCFESLGTFYPSAGMTDSVTHLFMATSLRAVPRDVHGPEEEHMEVVQVPLSEAVAMVLDGRIVDAKTVISVLRVERARR